MVSRKQTLTGSSYKKKKYVNCMYYLSAENGTREESEMGRRRRRRRSSSDVRVADCG